MHAPQGMHQWSSDFSPGTFDMAKLQFGQNYDFVFLSLPNTYTSNKIALVTLY